MPFNRKSFTLKWEMEKLVGLNSKQGILENDALDYKKHQRKTIMEKETSSYQEKRRMLRSLTTV